MGARVSKATSCCYLRGQLPGSTRLDNADAEQSKQWTRTRGGLRAAGLPGVFRRAAAARHRGLRRRQHRLRARREGAQRRLQGEARRAATHRSQALQPLSLARPAAVTGMPVPSHALRLSSPFPNNVSLVGC